MAYTPEIPTGGNGATTPETITIVTPELLQAIAAPEGITPSTCEVTSASMAGATVQNLATHLARCEEAVFTSPQIHELGEQLLRLIQPRRVTPPHYKNEHTEGATLQTEIVATKKNGLHQDHVYNGLIQLLVTRMNLQMLIQSHHFRRRLQLMKG